MIISEEDREKLEQVLSVKDDEGNAIGDRDLLLNATLQMIEDYAPAAPTPIKLEAVIRYMRYIDQYLSIGRTKIRSASANVLRACGSQYLLDRYKVKTAVII